MGLVLAPESSCGSPCAEPRRELLPRAGLGAGPTFPSKAGVASPAAASAKLWHEQYLRSEASQQLLTVVRNGDLLLVKAALTGLAVPDCCDGAGVTPLHAAVDGGHDEILVLLLARRASPEAPGGPLFDGPPAALASRRGHEDCLALLLNARAMPHARAGPELDAGTCLHFAAHDGHEGCIRLLLRAHVPTAKVAARGAVERTVVAHTDLLANLPDRRGRLPLHAAVGAEQPECAAVLLAEGFSLVDYTDGEGDGPIHLAAMASAQATGAEMCRMLVERGADVNLRTACQDTALHLAAMHGLVWVTQVLLQLAADPNLVESNKGRAPLHFASRHGSAEVCRLLVEALADPHIRDHSHGTALTCARTHACKDIVAGGMRRAECGSYAIANVDADGGLIA